MITLGLQGAHTGDILMALPAIGALLARGERVGVACPEVFAKPLSYLPISWTHGDQATDFADFRKKHHAEAWLDHFGVMPVRMEFRARRVSTDPCLPVGRWCLLSPWADLPAKRWAPERWVATGKIAARLGYKVAVVGPAKSDYLGAYITTRCEAVDLVARCTAQTWPALLEQAAVVVTPDTGAGHMADALGVPVIGLYGATKLDRCAPYWDRRYCIEAAGMDAITAQDVAKKLRAI